MLSDDDSDDARPQRRPAGGESAHMAETDAAVLRAVHDTLLHPEVVESVLAHAERALARDRRVAHRMDRNRE